MMNDDTLWVAIDDHRERIADLLAELTDDQWQHASLCDGWTVRHVAAHLTLQRQGVGDVLGFMARHPSLLRHPNLNHVIHESAVIQAGLPTTEIIARIRAGIGSRRHNAFVTSRETLTDILVHSQDIALPLGIDLPMRPDAAAEAATRVWTTRDTRLSNVFRNRPMAGFRLTATDIDWSVDGGPGEAGAPALDIDGPIAALLLLLTGRYARLDDLSGAGVRTFRRSLTNA